MPPKIPIFPPGENAGLDPVELKAAEWLVWRDRGLSAEQKREFDRWLRVDERHARVYSGLSQTWKLLDLVPADRLPVPPLRRNSKPAWAVVGSLAAAAALILAFTTLDFSTRSAVPISQSAATPVGGFEKIDLPDGSILRLNTASAVEVAYSTTERRVHLTQGEANFVVAKDKSRPFIVRVGQVDVRAVGTVFNVRRNSEAVEVLVTEGKVRVNDTTSGRSLLALPKPEGGGETPGSSPTGLPANGSASGEAPLLVAGQRLTLSTATRPAVAVASVVPVAPHEAARALAWQSRQVKFSLEPLENVVAELNRYNRHRLVIGDARLGSQRFGGKFPADDIESFVDLLERNFGVVAERRENETVLRLRP